MTLTLGVNRFRTALRLPATLLSLALVACGGGGDGGEPPKPPSGGPGSFVYVANNINVTGTVSAFKIDTATGALTPVSGSPFVAGANPNSIAVDPSGKFAYVANSASSSVSAYTIDAGTGALGAVAGSPFFTQFGALARAVAVDPLGRFVYVANEISGPPPPGVNNVLAYTINAGNGALTKVGAALPSGASPFSIAVDPGGKFVYVA